MYGFGVGVSYSIGDEASELSGRHGEDVGVGIHGGRKKSTTLRATARRPILQDENYSCCCLFSPSPPQRRSFGTWGKQFNFGAAARGAYQEKDKGPGLGLRKVY